MPANNNSKKPGASTDSDRIETLRLALQQRANDLLGPTKSRKLDRIIHLITLEGEKLPYEGTLPRPNTGTESVDSGSESGSEISDSTESHVKLESQSDNPLRLETEPSLTKILHLHLMIEEPTYKRFTSREELRDAVWAFKNVEYCSENREYLEDRRT